MKCHNCGKEGRHFIPPSFREAGFYICDNRQFIADVHRVMKDPSRWQDKSRFTGSWDANGSPVNEPD